MKLDFGGRVAIVTGAGQGMGRSHAIMLASRGCKVVVNDLGGKAVDHAANVVAEIEAAGGVAVADRHDVVTEAKQIVGTAIDQFGRLDIVVNNAGIWIGTTLAETDHQIYKACFDVSYTGTLEMCREAWPHLVKSGSGRIVNVSSSGMLGNSGLTSYGSAKAAIFGFSRSLAFEGVGQGITVNCILPSAWTTMTENIDDEGVQKTISKYFDPNHVSSLVTWLVHQDTTVNNEAFRVSGGTAARIVVAQQPIVRADDMTPETWVKQAPELLRAGELTPLFSTSDLFGRELRDADPETEFEGGELGF